MTPSINPRGRFFFGSPTSSAKSWLLPAAECEDNRDHGRADCGDEVERDRPIEDGSAKCAPAGARNHPQKTSAPMTTIFMSISAFCTVLPARTPRQLIAVRINNVPVAIQPSANGIASVHRSNARR